MQFLHPVEPDSVPPDFALTQRLRAAFPVVPSEPLPEELLSLVSKLEEMLGVD